MLTCIIIAVCIVIADQFLKYIIVSDMMLGQSVAVVPGILHLTYIQNPGAAFGILAQQRWLFIIIALLLLAAAAIFHRQIQKLTLSSKIAVAMLTGGAVGNMLDRILIGRVIDYIDFRIWPIFNFADIAIVLGCTFIIATLLFGRESKA